MARRSILSQLVWLRFRYEIYPPSEPFFQFWVCFLTIKRVLYSSMCLLCSFICIYNTCALEAANTMPPPQKKTLEGINGKLIQTFKIDLSNECLDCRNNLSRVLLWLRVEQ